MSTPTSIKVSAAAWAGAVITGVIESAFAIARLAAGGDLDRGVWLGIALRVVVFGVATVMVVGLKNGSRRARFGLTGLLCVLGLASLVVPALMSMASGQSLLEALSDGGSLGVGFAVIRATHIVLVVVATSAMYTATANAYIRGR